MSSDKQPATIAGPCFTHIKKIPVLGMVVKRQESDDSSDGFHDKLINSDSVEKVLDGRY